MTYKEIVLDLIGKFGYPGLAIGMLLEFTGLPFPGEIALGFAGFMVWQGVLDYVPTWAIALGFSWIGSLIAYFLGACLGRPFILKYGKYGGLNEEKMIKVESWFRNHRIIVLIFGRFISGVRPLSSYLAGMAGMPLFSFALLSFLGTTLWSSTFLMAGLILGAKWEKVDSYSIFIGLFFLVLSIILGLFLWWRRYPGGDNNEEI